MEANMRMILKQSVMAVLLLAVPVVIIGCGPAQPTEEQTRQYINALEGEVKERYIDSMRMSVENFSITKLESVSVTLPDHKFAYTASDYSKGIAEGSIRVKYDGRQSREKVEVMFDIKGNRIDGTSVCCSFGDDE